MVHCMDPLARNLDDLRYWVQKLTKRGGRVEFLKEGVVFTGDDSGQAACAYRVALSDEQSQEAGVLYAPK